MKSIHQAESIKRRLEPPRPLKFQHNGSANLVLSPEHQVLYALRQPNFPDPSFRTASHGMSNSANRNGSVRSLSTSSNNLSSSIHRKDVHTIATFSSSTLPIGSTHAAYVSYVENGPTLFTIQLKATETELYEMMSQLENVPLKHLTHKPSVGMACIAKYSRDNTLYRVVIITIMVDSCLVSYVDYGNSENVLFENLYDIPAQFLKHKIFAMRFTLSRVKKLHEFQVDIAELFSQLVLDTELTLKVIPLEGPPFVQYCELYKNNENIFDKLMNMAKSMVLKYPPPISFEIGHIEDIVIRYIECVKQFYIQPVKNIQRFDQTMDRLSMFCQKSKMLKLLNVGDPCAICCDQDWYRAEVVEIKNQKITAKLIDYGNTIEVDRSSVKKLSMEFVNYEPQVVECCLHGFESLTSDMSTTQLEMLAESVNGDRKVFKMNVVDKMTQSIFIVNLLDESVSPILNISKRLLKLKNYQHQKDYIKPPQNVVLNSTPISETHQSQQIEIIDLTNDDWTSNQSNNQSSGYSENCSRQNNSYKSPKYPRNDIPRFNKDRNLNENVQDVRYSKPKANSSNESGINNQTAKISASLESVEIVDYCSFDQKYVEQIVPMNTITPVVLSWWYSPDKFYVRIKSDERKFEHMMRSIQKFYKHKRITTENPYKGATIIAKYMRDNTLYRAQVIDYNEKVDKYKVEFIDFGNKTILTLNEIYKVDRKFMELPKMAIQCGLSNIKVNADRKELQDKIDLYVNNDQEIDCTFLEKMENNNYTTDIKTNGKDLKMALIQDNFISQIFTDIILERVKGQTLKIEIIEMNDLNRFKIKIYGNEAILNCSYVDATIGKDLSEQVKGQWLNVPCFAKIEDVSSEDRLILTLLIPQLCQQTPPAIVNMPVLMNIFNIFVTYVETVNCLYVQNTIWSGEISKLLDDMFDCYEQQGAIISNLTINEICAAKSSDGNWYRAKIVSLQDIDDIKVFFVDYGNVESVKHTDLKILESQFMGHSAYAQQVFLPMERLNESDEKSLIQEITTLTADFELTLTVLDYKQDTWIVDITSNDYSIINVLKDKQLVKSVENEEIFNKKIEAVQNGCLEEEVDDTNNNNVEHKDQQLKAMLSHIDHPNRFYIQMSSDVSDLEQFQENLQIIAPSLPQLRDFSNGKYCVAQYSADDLWYRAKIIDSHDDLIIQFVDYGNTDVITSNKKNELRDINDSLMKFKIYSKQCALLVGPVGSRWSEKVNDKLFDLEDVDVEFVTEVKNLNYIKIKQQNGKDLAESLIEEKVGVKLEYVPSGESCFSSHINSIGDFYIQLDKDTIGLDVMTDYLSDVSKFPPLQLVECGTICIAQFQDDCLWYRAKILAISDNEYEVVFIDYGNTSVVTEIRALPTEIAALPPLCTNCSLRLPENIIKWSKEADARFMNIAAMGETVFTVQLNAPGKHAIVDLYLNETNIINELVALCEKGVSNIMNTSLFLTDDKLLDDSFNQEGNVVISHVNSPSDFYIQFKNNFDALKNMEELLVNNAFKFERLTDHELVDGMFCIGFLPPFDTYYRVQILSRMNQQFQVFVVDYGFTSFATDLRKMPSNLEEIALLAKKCCLETFSATNSAYDLEALTNRLMQMSGKSQTIFRFEMVQSECDPVVIRLFDKNNKNIEDLLELDSSLTSNETCSNSTAPTIMVDKIVSNIQSASDVVDDIMDNVSLIDKCHSTNNEQFLSAKSSSANNLQRPNNSFNSATSTSSDASKKPKQCFLRTKSDNEF